MPNIIVRDIPDALYQDIKRMAREDHRSVNSQIIHSISDYVSRKKAAQNRIPEISDIHADIDVKGFELLPGEMKKVIHPGRS